jgi:gamma-glutamyltranspeptidase/glutathione hydrolase
VTVQPFVTRPELTGTFGMVVSTHWLATAAGMAVLERGGNAFDAAVAAGFVLEVVEPHRYGPAGDLALLLYESRTDSVQVLCGQGPAPAAATPSAFRGLGLELVPGNGLLPACVPGSFGGWLLLLERYGSWRLRDVLAFARGYAEHGYPMVRGIAETIASVAGVFADDWTESARLYLTDGRPPQAGARFRNPDLAATYARIVSEAEAGSGSREQEIERARRAWYEGFVAERIDAFCTTSEFRDMTGQRHCGLLRGNDLAAWRATVEAPKSFDYHDWRMYKTGPWGQGPVFLQQLALLSSFDLRDLDPSGAELAHLIIESTKLAMADREAWYGDPNFVPDVIDDLLTPSYTTDRRRLIGEVASREMRPGAPGGRAPVLPIPSDPPTEELVAMVGFPEPQGKLLGDTSHVDVVDRWGNMVAATPSGGWLQSSPTIPGLGFCLGTRLQMSAVQEGLPNTLAPGKRPRTTLSPSLALRDRQPKLAFGTPGGDQQDQWTLTFFVRLAATEWDLQRVLELPMFHSDGFFRSYLGHYWHPARIAVEQSFTADVIAELSNRGHDVRIFPPWQLGRVCAAGQDRASGVLRAAANPRGMQAYAAGR